MKIPIDIRGFEICPFDRLTRRAWQTIGEIQ